MVLTGPLCRESEKYGGLRRRCQNVPWSAIGMTKNSADGSEALPISKRKELLVRNRDQRPGTGNTTPPNSSGGPPSEACSHHEGPRTADEAPPRQGLRKEMPTLPGRWIMSASRRESKSRETGRFPILQVAMQSPGVEAGALPKAQVQPAVKHASAITERADGIAARAQSYSQIFL